MKNRPYSDTHSKYVMEPLSKLKAIGIMENSDNNSLAVLFLPEIQYKTVLSLDEISRYHGYE